MKIKRFVGKDIRAALNQVKTELGADAVIMSNSKTAEGVEIVAAVDNTPQPPAQTPQPEMAAAPYEEKTTATQPKKVANSLQAILQRQAEQSAKDAVAQVAKRVTPTFAEPAESFQATTLADESNSLQDEWDYPSNSANSANSGMQSAQNHAESDASELHSIKSEMAELRKLLQHQVSGLMWQDVARNHPQKAYVIDSLKKMGISEEVAEQVAAFIDSNASQADAWQQALQLLGNQVSVTRNDIMRQGGVVALVGPTGVGKTTTVAKLAAHFAKKHGADSVALVTTDTYRIGAHEQLQTYAKIIGCPCKVAHDGDELSQILQQLRNRKLVLIDSAGMGQKDTRLAAQLDVLMQSSSIKIRSYLVLQATAQQRVMQEAVRHFKRTNLAGCIFTKLDECSSLGEIISVAIQNNLPIGYLTDGQRVPEDIKVASASYLVKKAAKYFETQLSVQANETDTHAFAAAF